MDMKLIGRFLSELRKSHGMTQEQLGERLGVTGKTISRWETGNYLPPVDMLLELSRMYDLSINELLTGKKLTAEEDHEAAETWRAHSPQRIAWSISRKSGSVSILRKLWLSLCCVF